MFCYIAIQNFKQISPTNLPLRGGGEWVVSRAALGSRFVNNPQTEHSFFWNLFFDRRPGIVIRPGGSRLAPRQYMVFPAPHPPPSSMDVSLYERGDGEGRGVGLGADMGVYGGRNWMRCEISNQTDTHSSIHTSIFHIQICLFPLHLL